MQNSAPRRRHSPPLPKMNRHDNIFVDSQILNLIADKSDEDMNVLVSSEQIQLLMPHSVVLEVERPETPALVKQAAFQLLRTIQVGLNADEEADLNRFIVTHIGKKKPENIVSDLKHAWEARKYGRFLISTDHDLLSRAIAIRKWNGLHILRPAEARALHDSIV